MKQAYRKRSDTAERVAAEIRRAIRHRDLLPGEHVRQSWWAEKVGVSSGSTREALKVLVSEGLLSYDAHRGYFVSRINPDEMAQIYQIRRVLETEVLRSIRWPNDNELKAIRSLMDAAIECVRRADGHGALENSRQVSFAIFDLSALDILVAETKRYWDRAMVYRALVLGSVQDTGAERITELYDGYHKMLKRRDREGLIAIHSTHLPHVLVRIEWF